MYKSPIEIIQGELHTKMEGEIMKAVQQVGISVDKDELLHALAYDRSQYQLGFIDGKIKAMEELVHCEDCRYWDNRFDVMVCNLTDGMKGASDYCSYGERREDD